MVEAMRARLGFLSTSPPLREVSYLVLSMCPSAEERVAGHAPWLTCARRVVVPPAAGRQPTLARPPAPEPRCAVLGESGGFVAYVCRRRLPSVLLGRAALGSMEVLVCCAPPVVPPRVSGLASPWLSFCCWMILWYTSQGTPESWTWVVRQSNQGILSVTPAPTGSSGVLPWEASWCCPAIPACCLPGWSPVGVP